MRRPRRPAGDDLWLLAGYAVWVALIFGIWQLVTRVRQAG